LAKDKLDMLKLNDDERVAYESHQRNLQHQASNYEPTYILGRVEGVIQGKIESAQKMLDGGLGIVDVIKFSGLSEEEVKALKVT
jgi:hypothetical protein